MKKSAPFFAPLKVELLLGSARRALVLHWRTPLISHSFTLMWLEFLGYSEPSKRWHRSRFCPLTWLILKMEQVYCCSSSSHIFHTSLSCSYPLSFTSPTSLLGLNPIWLRSVLNGVPNNSTHANIFSNVNTILAAVKPMPSAQLLSEAQLPSSLLS